MNGTAWLRLMLTAAVAVLFSACQLSGAPPYTPAGLPPRGQGFASPLPAPPQQGQPQSPLAYPWPGRLLLVDADTPDCVGVAGLDGYQMVRRTAVQPKPVDGTIQRQSPQPSISEFVLVVTRTVGPLCNIYRAQVTVDPQTGKRSVMDESYTVDDLFFAYCTLCGPPYHSGTWYVFKRSPGEDPNRFPLGITPTNIGPIAVAQLMAQSSVVGEEEMNGFATVHRRFTDLQVLAEAGSWQVGGAAEEPLELTAGQVDLWLTRDTHRLVRLRFQVEGERHAVSGSAVHVPFVLTDEFNLHALDRDTPIVVPPEVLAAVAEQLKALQGE